MRIRRNYWFVPALAILGLLFAVMQFCMQAMQYHHGYCYRLLRMYARPLMNDPDVILEAVRRNPNNLQFVKKTLRNKAVLLETEAATRLQAAKPTQPQTLQNLI